MRRVLIVRLVMLVMIGACGARTTESGPEPLPDPPKDALTKPLESGPVKVTERVWPAKPNLGEPIYVRLDIETAAGTSVTAPFQEAGDARLGRFKVEAFAHDEQRNADGSQHQRQVFTLSAASSGKHRIPPLRFELVDARADHAGSAAGKPQELLTDEVALEVAPVKTEAIGAELKRGPGKLDPDVGGPPWMLILLGASAVAVLGAGGVLLLRARKVRAQVAARRSAYEEAVAKLGKLEQRGAPDPATTDAWFVELSAIVRDYLEQRYEIRAPELTTEEFLQVASRDPNLKTDHRALLSTFLALADRVKFAGYLPESAESLASLEVARRFVEDTRLGAQDAAGRGQGVAA